MNGPGALVGTSTVSASATGIWFPGGLIGLAVVGVVVGLLVGWYLVARQRRRTTIRRLGIAALFVLLGAVAAPIGFFIVVTASNLLSQHGLLGDGLGFGLVSAVATAFTASLCLDFDAVPEFAWLAILSGCGSKSEVPLWRVGAAAAKPLG